MSSKLILIEGLPGSGKTTTARWVHDILSEMNVKSRLFLEGNLEHPADYDGVAFFEKVEWDELLSRHEAFKELLSNRVIEQGSGCFLEYRKMQSELLEGLPGELLQAVMKKDVYELPLEQNRKLITKRWKRFAEDALGGSEVFIFECCFIQNPLTIGMVKYGARAEDVINYVNELAAIVERLNPLLIYVEQDDLEHSFRKAVKERPREWSEGFIEYYTGQGYGKQQGYEGLEGTLQVLKARRELEEEIVNSLNMATKKVNNSSYDMAFSEQVLPGILSEYFS